MERGTKTEILSVTQVAQQALEGLLRGETVPESDNALLMERRRRFQIMQGNRFGLFDLTQVGVSLGSACPGVYVDVRASTDRGPETFRLGMDADGNPDFEVTCLSEIPGAAGPI